MNELKLTLKEAELIRAYYMGDTYSGNRSDVKEVFQKIEDFVIEEWNKDKADKCATESEWGCDARKKLGIARGAISDVIDSIAEATNFPGDENIIELLESALKITAQPTLCSQNEDGARCDEHESGGVRCELERGHQGNHACPKALETYLMCSRNIQNIIDEIDYHSGSGMDAGELGSLSDTADELALIETEKTHCSHCGAKDHSCGQTV